MNSNTLHSGFYEYEAFSPRRRERGFTIIELLVAMAVASIVAMSGFALFSQSNWSYQVQESVGEAQQNARIATDRIVRDIRTAGFGLPKDPSITLDGETFETPILVEDATGYDGSDKITILGIGYEAGELSEDSNENTKGTEYICYSPTTTAEKIVTDGARVGASRKYVSIDGAFSAELNTSIDSVACAGGVTLPLNIPSKLKGDFESGTVYIIQAVEYSIVTDITGCSTTHPCLASEDFAGLRGSGRQLLAENIEDIQFAYGIDDSGEVGSAIDCATTASATPGFKCSPASGEESDIRAVRVTLSARTRNRDPKGATFNRPAIENHPASDPPDNYRRRILTKVVKIRN